MAKELDVFSDAYEGARLRVDDAQNPNHPDEVEVTEMIDDKMRGRGVRYRNRGAAPWEAAGILWDSTLKAMPDRYTIRAVSPNWD